MTMTITQQIIQAMDDSGMSRYCIAAESGVSAGQLSRLARGMSELSATNLEKVATALGYSVALVPHQQKRPTTKASKKTRKQTTTKGA